MTREERYAAVLNHFRKVMPTTETELRWATEFQLLVAVILSAQCTDKRVNMVTPELFAQYPDANSLAVADVEDVRQLISSISYPNAKTVHIIEMSKGIVNRFGGDVPQTREELMSLQGVGRKTANVMMAVAFGKPTMAVDTHVFRVSHRLGLVAKNDDTPLKVEQRLVRHIPTADIPNAHHWLLLHGRYTCVSRKPHCGECPFVSGICPCPNPGASGGENRFQLE